MPKNIYESPLASRYASAYMLALFSPDHRYQTWRRLWAALADCERTLGLPVSEEQVEELYAHAADAIDYELVEKREQEIRHDVMAHIYAFGVVCPRAKPILHWGATSCYVTDNADLIIYRDALRHLRRMLLDVIGRIAAFAARYRTVPTLGYTHLQPAQPTTVGKRACLWIQDLLMDLSELDSCLESIRFLGCRGATGSEASLLALFNGDGKKVDALNTMLCEKFGFAALFPVSGQTYPRKLDSRILSTLSSIAQSAYRFGGDIRLLQQMRELEEPFEGKQVGSSAMAYKRNPMRCERICSLARYAITGAMNAPLTASAQSLERTLDDSANRRIALPEVFLATDAVLRLMKNVASGLTVNEKIIQNHMTEYLPFIATENILMAAVKKGGDRQALHEIIRGHSMAAATRMKDGGRCDLLVRLAADAAFPLCQEEMAALLVPNDFVGRCEEQVECFLESIPATDEVDADDALVL